AQALQRRGHQALLVLLERRIEHVIPAGLALHVVGSARKGTFGAWLAAFRIRRLFRRLGLDSQWLTVSTLPFADRVAIAARLPNLWCRITNTLSAEADQLARKDKAKARRRL